MLIRSCDPRSKDGIAQLDSRMMSFYKEESGYYDCAASTDKSIYFVSIMPIVNSILETKDTVRILEIGAGKTQLFEYLCSTIPRQKLTFCAHDVNKANEEYFKAIDVPLYVGPVTDLEFIEPFDIIVSFFVYEHMTDPRAALEKMSSLVQTNGRIVIVSPKYTALFYIPPAIRHFRTFQRLRTHVRLVVDHFLASFTKRANFYVVTDPAVFYGKWRRDSDAVHMVSERDLKVSLGDKWLVKRLPIKYPSFFMSLFMSLTLLCVSAERRDRESQ